jgi:pimeloyl-ACP methyl ester carboxylesterase
MTESIVLIPGLLCDGVVWEHQAADLRKDFKVTVADVTRQSSFGDMARAIFDEVPGSLSIVGHSMGARVALEMVRLSPARVDRLALLDTGVHGRRDDEIERRQLLVDLGVSEGMRAVAEAWLPPMVDSGALERDPELRDKLYAMVERMTPQIHRQQIQALLDRPDASGLLSTLRCPVLIGVGENDRWSPPEQHRLMAEAVRHARFTLFERSGHMAPMEAPQAVTAALRDWMTQATRGTDE